LEDLRGTGQHRGDHAGLCKPEGCGPVEIMIDCESPAWQALGSQSSKDCASLRGGSLGEHGPGRAEE
jgi:hypothetical protein